MSTNLFQACLCATGKLAGGGEDDRLRRRTSVERSQQLSDARQGDERLAVQVAGECLQTRTILGGLRNLRGKLSLYARTTARTLLHLCLMLGHFDAGWRYFKYLPFLIPFDSLRLHLCLTTRSIRQPMNDDMVRFCHLHQGASLVPALPPHAAAGQSGADSCACLSSDHRCSAACRCCDCLSPVDPAIAGSTPGVSQSVPAAVGSLPVALPLADARPGSTQGSLDIAALAANDLLPWIHSCLLLYYNQQNFGTAFLRIGRLSSCKLSMLSLF